MNTEIYYFSGTGNSLAIARMLSKKIPESRVYSLSKRMESDKYKVLSADRIGIVFPTYCHNLPMQVEQFLKTLRIEGQSYIFAIVTHNGEYGCCGDRIEGILKAKGMALNYSNQILMPGNSIMADGYTNSEEEQMRRIRASEERVKEISGDILSEKNALFQNPDSFFDNMKGKMMYFAMKNVLKINEKFYSKEQCTQCGICKKVCPKNNIVINEKPEWGEDCEYCLACIHWCPTRAVQINKGTEKRIRYHHPDVKVKDIAFR